MKSYIYFIILILAILAQAQGKIGYDIYVTVNNSTSSSSWGRSQSSSVFDFISESHCKGDGNSSKYIRINGLAGINFKEDTYTKKGRLKDDQRLTTGCAVNSISINEVVSNNSEKYSVTINESMPSYLMSIDEIAYKGEGIYKRNSYINNKDEIITAYQAKKFSESAAYLAKYRNALIIADVTPTNIAEFAGENYSTMIQLTSQSDLYSGFKFKSSGQFIEEDFVGSFKLAKKISNEHIFGKYDPGELDSLPICCPPGYAGLDYSLQAAWLCLCRQPLVDLSQGMK